MRRIIEVLKPENVIARVQPHTVEAKIAEMKMRVADRNTLITLFARGEKRDELALAKAAGYEIRELANESKIEGLPTRILWHKEDAVEPTYFIERFVSNKRGAVWTLVSPKPKAEVTELLKKLKVQFKTKQN